jgi:hypothetical protein
MSYDGFEPTCKLRWAIRDIPFDMCNSTRVLQQEFATSGRLDYAQYEWRDVPVVDQRKTSEEYLADIEARKAAHGTA